MFLFLYFFKTWSGWKRPGLAGRDLVWLEETWSGWKRPGQLVRDRQADRQADRQTDRWL